MPSKFQAERRKTMKKAMTLGFVLALALAASAQSAVKVRPNAHVGGTAISRKAANSTFSVPPVAKPGPVAVPGKTKKK
jgi:hypothetical protein